MPTNTRSNAKPLPMPVDPTIPDPSGAQSAKLPLLPRSTIPVPPKPPVEQPSAKEKAEEKPKRGGRGRKKDLAVTESQQSIEETVDSIGIPPAPETGSSEHSFAVPLIIPAPHDPDGVLAALGLQSVVNARSNLEHHSRAAFNEVQLATYIVNLRNVSSDIQAIDPVSMSTRLYTMENETIPELTSRLDNLPTDNATNMASEVDAVRREMAAHSEALTQSLTQLRNQCMTDRSTTDKTIGSLRTQIEELASNLTTGRVASAVGPRDDPGLTHPPNPPLHHGPPSLATRNTSHHPNAYAPYGNTGAPHPQTLEFPVIYGPHPAWIVNHNDDPIHRARAYLNELRIIGARSHNVTSASRMQGRPDTYRIVFNNWAAANAFVVAINNSRPTERTSAAFEG